MLRLNSDSIKNIKIWEEAKINLPKFDREKMISSTHKNPQWIHFGSGNILRGFIALLQQMLLEMDKAETGIIACELFDYEIIEKVYRPYENLSLLVVSDARGSLEKTVIGSIADSIIADASRKDEWDRLCAIFTKPSLQVCSFTITEKGYSIKGLNQEYLPIVKEDIENGPINPKSSMGKVAALLYVRFKNGQYPITLLSLDNCSHNGEKLYNSVRSIADKWYSNNLVEKEFIDYIDNPEKVAFPWSMIDKIVPRPSESIKKLLEADEFVDTEISCTSKNTYVAPFVNAEKAHYLVIEDTFANSRPKLEYAGVYFTDRETTENVERMKVQTCLNPLHTALAVFGCLLGYNLIADEMKDKELTKLIEKIGYEEGMKVVVHQKIIDPNKYLSEVINERFPNPYIPDTPQRIATDTSQKIPIRFGETIKGYLRREDLNVLDLKYIPLAIAGWIRYLLGIDDEGKTFIPSPDPLLETLQGYLKGIEIGDVNSIGDKLKPILSNKELFGADLYEIGLAQRVEEYFKEMTKGKGAVRKTLEKYLR